MNTENQMLTTAGIHHITAVASSAAHNLDFYTRLLGLRLVKKTVNFDDPFTYHLYYGDDAGRPGTILTFFPWEALPQGRPGAGMVSAMALAVVPTALDHWRARLADHHVAFSEQRRFGETVLRFTDPHGLPLELIAAEESATSAASGTDMTTAITGFHSATLLLHRLAPTEAVIADAMGMQLRQQEGNRHRFAMGDRGAPGHLIDIVVDPRAPVGRPGGGTVHHIAFRTRDRQEQQAWQQHLRRRGLAVTDVRDRQYFRSIYFSEPGGVLFEIATDPPGFAVDERPDQLGTALKLPAQFESMRRTIEQRLPPLEHPRFQHIYRAAADGRDGEPTIVALHGTGGDENDLLPLVRRIRPAAPVISLRGNVLENNMPRFFKRLAEGVFDASEVRHRANQLADFLADAARRYGRPADQLVALGYSNGANIAAAMLLLRPETLAGAVLLRPMLPLEPATLPNLSGTPVLILSGRMDTIIPRSSTVRLAHILQRAGATVEVAEIPADHTITARDVATAADWLARHLPTPSIGVPEAVNQ